MSLNPSCLKMSNKDVSEIVSERVKGSDGRWRNRETAAENVQEPTFSLLQTLGMAGLALFALALLQTLDHFIDQTMFYI